MNNAHTFLFLTMEITTFDELEHLEHKRLYFQSEAHLYSSMQRGPQGLKHNFAPVCVMQKIIVSFDFL
jgi:hypothetical protein